MKKLTEEQRNLNQRIVDAFEAVIADKTQPEVMIDLTLNNLTLSFYASSLVSLRLDELRYGKHE